MLQEIDYHAILPELILGGAALLVLIVDLFVAPPRKWVAMPLSLAGVIGSFVALATLIDGDTRSTFCLESVKLGGGNFTGCSYVVDDFSIILKMIFLGSAFVVLLLSLNYFNDERFYQGEYYFLLLCSFFGMLTMASSRDLIMLFISLEIVSVPGFIIAGMRKSDTRSTESAIKFFLIGVLSTAVMLFGMSIVYGMTGSVQLETIAKVLDGNFQQTPAMAAGVALVIVGFGFKVSAVPFHFWAPDTYQGAPVPVAAFLSVASKAAGFTGLIVVCVVGLRPYAFVWGPLLAVLATMTMTLGNLVAVQQKHMVRLLAYSSIGQAGYMLVPLSIAATVTPTDALLNQAVAATVAYIAIYAVLNLGIFGCVIAVGRLAPRNLVADYRGLARSNPMLAAAIAFFMLGLAGVPPALAGLVAKFYVFRAAIDNRMGWLAAVMAVNTVIAAWYYLRIAFTVFAGAGDPAGESPLERPRVPVAVVTAIAISLVAAIAIGFYPDLVFRYGPVFAQR